MFKFLKYPQQISDLTTQKVLLETKLANANIKIKELEDKIKSPPENTSVQSFSLNFSVMDVFSIERNSTNNKNDPCTIVGHFLTGADGSKQTAEWYLYCSPETHNNLVKEFNEFKLKGTNGTK